ncbi:mitochondrial carrier homolog 1-like [Synchiropus splendidus]|uniref:mitochondrial carrier homolog 1-like n=1 Tax=Synchiropus splendidus TaxID=270530 RepID=UPI00237E9F21|nr:mitochondrial carrier homolog 1-like [Synchiropus splendidus]XP_053704621.1 mitochondrial carrier homolog 1-like [Synchiropus splendidus]XP_053704622.1 mitochondrial carrier homolog 1-like [Synchiropus splendidus]
MDRSPDDRSSPGDEAGSVEVDSGLLLLGAGVTTLTHPLIYVKLLIQLGHEPLSPTMGTTLFGRRVLYLPGFFSYARYIVKVDGKIGLFRGLSTRIMSSTVSTVIRCRVKQAQLSSKDGSADASLRKVVKETSQEMMVQCVSRVLAHPFHVMSVRCMAQFVGREVKYSGILRCVSKIFQEEGIFGFYVGVVPHMLGEVLFLWCCNLLAHFINTYAVDDSFSQASAIRGYSRFVMGIAVSVLTYPFMLVADIMAVNNCGLVAGLPPHSPIFRSWLHCWKHLSQQGLLFRGSSFFSRRVPTSCSASCDD